MAIDINAESDDLLTLADAAKLLPVFNGKRTHVSTLWRWCFKGSQGVQLEYTRLGSRILTTQARPCIGSCKPAQRPTGSPEPSHEDGPLPSGGGLSTMRAMN